MNKIIERAHQTIAGALPPPPIGALLGMRLVAVETGRARFELDADARHRNPMATCTAASCATSPTRDGDGVCVDPRGRETCTTWS